MDLGHILFGIIGLVIGWNLPQPEWAKKLQQKVIDFFKGLGGSKK